MADLDECEVLLATLDHLTRGYGSTMIGTPLEMQCESQRMLDMDTSVFLVAWAVARCASGARVSAVDAGMHGSDSVTFYAVRSPGGHVTSGTAIGLWLFNDIVLVSVRALEADALEWMR